MEDLFGGILVTYIIVCMLAVPTLAIVSYSEKRDCETKFDVGQCMWQILPYTGETK